MDGREQGKRGEKIGEMACEHLRKTWDHLVYHMNNRLLDSGGGDRLLILKSGLACVLQFKTSESGAEAHLHNRNRPWYRFIPVILMTPEEIEKIYAVENIEGVAARIKAKIIELYRKIKESPLPL